MIIEERLASSSPRRTRASSEPCWVKAGEEPAWEEQRPGACSMQHRLADWALTRAVIGGQMQAWHVGFAERYTFQTWGMSDLVFRFGLALSGLGYWA